MSNRMIAWLSILGVVVGIAFSIFLTQTLLAPIIERADWFPDNGIIGVVLWLLLYVFLALLAAPASFHKFISGILFGFWLGWVIAFVGAVMGAILPFCLQKNICMDSLKKKLLTSQLSKA